MLIIDRVFCDSCRCYVGQLFNAPAQSADCLPDLSSAPEYVTCPDCESDLLALEVAA